MKKDAIINKKLISLTDNEKSNAEKFHLSRFKFAIINENVIFGDKPGDDRDHQHWLLEDYGISLEKFEKLNRGYIFPNKIHLYIGSDFRPVNLTDITIQNLVTIINYHNKQYGNIGNIDIFNGVKVGKVGEIWPPIQKIVTIYNDNRMKLFQVDYMDDCDNDTYMTVGYSKEEVLNRETEKLQTQCACFMGCFVYEIDEVDGHKIIVE